MTYSSCWIDSDDDEQLRALIAVQDPLGGEGPHVLGPSPKGYWIGLVHEWARRNQLSTEYTTNIEIRVKVSREQGLDFLTWVYGELPASAAFLGAQLRSECSYWLYADEF